MKNGGTGKREARGERRVEKIEISKNEKNKKK